MKKQTKNAIELIGFAIFIVSISSGIIHIVLSNLIY